MKPKFSLTQLITTAFLLMIFSCTKENSQDGTIAQQEEQASITSSESDGEAEGVYNGIFDDAMGVSDEVGMAGTGIFGRTYSTNTGIGLDAQRLTGCQTVTITHPNTTIFPIRVVIDFGTSGCTGIDGHVGHSLVIDQHAAIGFFGFEQGSLCGDGNPVGLGAHLEHDGQGCRLVDVEHNLILLEGLEAADGGDEPIGAGNQEQEAVPSRLIAGGGKRHACSDVG